VGHEIFSNRQILQEYRAVTVPTFSRTIIKEIVNSAGHHIGIFGILASKLAKMLERGGWLSSHWQEQVKDLYDVLRKNPVYSIIITSLEKDNCALLHFVEKEKIFTKEIVSLVKSSFRDELVINGVLRFVSSDESSLIWTSPIIREFVTQYVAGIGQRSFLPVPVFNSKIDFLNLFYCVGTSIDLKTMMEDEQQQTVDFNPLEYGIHAEFYRVMKGMILNSDFCNSYHVKFEGRVETGNLNEDMI